MGIQLSDPIKHCKYYQKYGCSHVDGYLCNLLTCNILKQYNKDILRSKKLNKIKNRLI